jgi:hypothetical protein
MHLYPPIDQSPAPREMDLAQIADPESNTVSEQPTGGTSDDRDGVVDNDNPGMRALELLASSLRSSQHVHHMRISLNTPNYTGVWLPPAPPPFSVTRLIHKAIVSLENLKSLDVIGGICSDGAQARALANQLNEREGSARLRKLTFEECWFIPPLSGGSLALAHLTELDWSFLSGCTSSLV